MDETEIHLIGRHRITLNFRDGVGPASAYSLLLAENIPDLTGKTVVDLGTGSGILAIVASLQGAKKFICSIRTTKRSALRWRTVSGTLSEIGSSIYRLARPYYRFQPVKKLISFSAIQRRCHCHSKNARTVHSMLARTVDR